MELTKVLSSGIDANSVTPAILTKIGSSFDADSSTLTVPNLSVTTVSGGNIKTNNLLYANGSAYIFTTNAAGSNTQIQFNNANNFAGSSNLTFNNATKTLTSTNLTVSGVTTLGTVSNVKISGGSANYVLKTDGTGNLSWTSSASAPISLGIGVDNFTGNGTEANYTLTNTPANINCTIVSIAGLFQPRTVYSLSGNVVTFSSAPKNTAPIEITTFTSNGSGGSGSTTVSGLTDVLLTSPTNGQSLTYDSANSRWINSTVSGGGGGGSGTPGGVDTQVQINDAGSFGGNAGFTFNKTTGVFSAPSIVVTGDITPSANVTYSLGNNTNRFSNLYLAGNTIDLGGAIISATETGITFTNPAGGTFAVTGNSTATGSNLGNLVTANYFAGSGNNLSNIQGANISGTVASATVAASANAVAGANVSGAVSFATTANVVAGANVSGQVGNSLLAGTVYTNAQPNITSVGSLTALTVTGNSSFGNIGNVSITGGANGQFIKTDGAGNLSWGAVEPSYISNGTSNVTVVSSGGNIATSVGGTSNVMVATTTGISVTGNVSAGNGYFTGNVFSSYSDVRLKTILGTIENPTVKVGQIETFYYEPNDLAVSLGVSPGYRQVGVSAQSVQRVVPEAVAPSPIDQNYLTVQYERLVPLLIEAVKELTKEVEQLKKHLESK